jgi:hypothetical protein
LREVLRKASTPLVAMLLAATVFMAYSTVATATHQPADKVQASGSDLEHVEDDTVVLAERMRVSSPSDLIIQVTAECSILTALTTNNDNPSSTAAGSVRFHVEVDGVPVPVALDEGIGQDDADDDDNEVGEVTFCNRAYSRTVVDEEDPADGIDEESDYIRTRTANAFNWFAINTGEVYDNPANGNNILDIAVIADYDTSTAGEAIADAFVGSRTLIIEPVHSQNDQVVAPE